jgi:phosphoserine phosphatase RsbU/P
VFVSPEIERTDEPLEPVLNQVVAELRESWPDRAIEVQFALADPVNCDRTRIGQLFSNLLANAVKHGARHR